MDPYNFYTAPSPAALSGKEGQVDFSSRRFADVVVALPVGPIDHSNARELERALEPILDAASAAGTPVVLVFAGVEYLSSMGLRVLMVAAKQMRASSARIAVASLKPVVAEIFDIARFGHVLEVFASLHAALEALSASALAAYDAPR